MRRGAGIAGIWLALLLVQPAQARPALSHPAMAEALPMPPPPAPPDPQSGVRAAPIPDRDMTGLPPPLPETTVQPRMFRQRGAGFNEGYLPGSQFQSEEERRVIATPGVTVKVPLP